MNLNDNIKKILVTQEEIEKRCIELAKELDKDYCDKKPLILSLLKGSMPFTVELTKYMTIPLDHGGTVSFGNVAVSIMPSTNLQGRNILIIEDIIDTGTTLSTVVKILEELHPASIEIATLLDKPSRRIVADIKPKYVGFVIPDEFVVGFGLDYDELYRQLPYVGVLKEEVYKK